GCRAATALAKLAALRARLRRFGRLRAVLKKLFAPGLEKALVFLDERLMGATSNAVERGNRRYRKMQKMVYRVRTRRAIEGRLALDLLRESQGEGRGGTTEGLHKARAAWIHCPVSFTHCRKNRGMRLRQVERTKETVLRRRTRFRG